MPKQEENKRPPINVPFGFGGILDNLFGGAPAAPDLIAGGLTDTIAGVSLPGTVTPAASGIGSFIGGAAPFALPIAAGIGGAHHIIDNFGDLDAGEGALSGFLAGGPVGALTGLAASVFSSGKDKDQRKRDNIRSGLQKIGLADDKFSVGLADGSRFDVGAESIKNFDGSDGEIFNLPWDKNPELVGQVVGLTDPIAELITGGSKDGFNRESLSMMLANAALSNSKGDLGSARNNVLQIVKDLGLTPDGARAGLADLRESGAIDDNRFQANINALNGLVERR